MDKSPELRRLEGMREQLLLSEKDRGVLWNENQTLREALAANQREREQLQAALRASRKADEAQQDADDLLERAIGEGWDNCAIPARRTRSS